MINRQQINIVNYIVVCIDEFASRLNLNGRDAFSYLNRYNGINFLKENYEIEHTLSIDDAIEDMITICKNNGGNLSWGYIMGLICSLKRLNYKSASHIKTLEEAFIALPY